MVERRISLLYVTAQLIERNPVVGADVSLVHQAQTVQIAYTSFSHARDVDLIKGKPIFYLVLVAPEHCLRVAKEQINGLSRIKALVLRHNIPGDLIMAQGHQGLNTVLSALIEHLVVKSQSRLIRFLVIPVRKDPDPVDRQSEAFEAHLRKQRDILFIAMIKINSLVAGIKSRRIRLGQKSPGRIYIPAQQQIRNTQSFAVLQICPLTLIGCHSAAPQKVLRESHTTLLLFRSLEPAAHCLANSIQISKR